MKIAKRDVRVKRSTFLVVFSGVMAFAAVILVLMLLTGAGYLPKAKDTYSVGYQIPDEDGSYGNTFYRELVQVERSVESEKLENEIGKLVEEKVGRDDIYILGYKLVCVDSIYPR